MFERSLLTRTSVEGTPFLSLDPFTDIWAKRQPAYRLFSGDSESPRRVIMIDLGRPIKALGARALGQQPCGKGPKKAQYPQLADDR